MPNATTTIDSPYELAAEQFELIARKLADDVLYGSDSSRFLGPGIDYAQSRIFVEGDAVRDIDWRVTARLGVRHVREYEAPRRIPVYIVLDTSASMAIASTRRSKHEIGLWITGALAFASLRALRPVAIVDCGERHLRATPSLARGDLRRWIRRLEPPSLSEQTRLTERLDRFPTIVSCRSTLVIVSDMHDPGAAGAINRLAPRHDCLVLRLRDPVEHRGLRCGFVRTQEAETGRRALAWRRPPRLADPTDPTAQEALSAHVDRTVIDTTDPIVDSLRSFLNSRRARGSRTR